MNMLTFLVVLVPALCAQCVLAQSDSLITDPAALREILLSKGLSEKHPRILELDKAIKNHSEIHPSGKDDNRAPENSPADGSERIAMHGKQFQGMAVFVAPQRYADLNVNEEADGKLYSILTSKGIKKHILAIYPLDEGVIAIVEPGHVVDLVMALHLAPFSYGIQTGPVEKIFKRGRWKP